VDDVNVEGMVEERRMGVMGVVGVTVGGVSIEKELDIFKEDRGVGKNIDPEVLLVLLVLFVVLLLEEVLLLLV